MTVLCDFQHTVSLSLSEHCPLLPLQGASSPLVVKVADTEREKAQKKLQRAIATQGQAIGLGSIPALGLGTLASAAYYQQVGEHPS